MTAITTTSSAEVLSLDTLADRIRSRLKRTLADMLATGADLIEAKNKLPHGAFGKWITAEFGMTDRTAQNYMRGAEWAAEHNLKSETVSDLPSATVYKIAADTTPAEIKAEVAEKIRSGSTVDVEQIEMRIDMARAEAAKDRRSKARRRKIDTASPAVRRRLEQQERQQAAEKAKRDAATAEAAAILAKLDSADLHRLAELMKTGIWFHDIAKAVLPGRSA